MHICIQLKLKINWKAINNKSKALKMWANPNDQTTVLYSTQYQKLEHTYRLLYTGTVL